MKAAIARLLRLSLQELGRAGDRSFINHQTEAIA
jgi:hypothetical protein